MVLDNVDDIDLINSILPRRRSTRHILITTRYREAYSEISAERITIEEMIQSEARELFLRPYCRSDKQVQARAMEYDDAVRGLVAELGNLPLAIIQSSAYLRANQDEISSFIEIYGKFRDPLWKWTPTQGSVYMSIATIMALSFQKIKHREESVRAHPFLVPTTFRSPY
jgi:hypothetical protein